MNTAVTALYAAAPFLLSDAPAGSTKLDDVVRDAESIASPRPCSRAASRSTTPSRTRAAARRDVERKNSPSGRPRAEPQHRHAARRRRARRARRPRRAPNASSWSSSAEPDRATAAAMSTNTPIRREAHQPADDDHRHLVHALEESHDRLVAARRSTTVAAAPKMHTAMISGSRSARLAPRRRMDSAGRG